MSENLKRLRINYLHEEPQQKLLTPLRFKILDLLRREDLIEIQVRRKLSDEGEVTTQQTVSRNLHWLLDKSLITTIIRNYKPVNRDLDHYHYIATSEQIDSLTPSKVKRGSPISFTLEETALLRSLLKADYSDWGETVDILRPVDLSLLHKLAFSDSEINSWR
jgi:hypothetical protein